MVPAAKIRASSKTPYVGRWRLSYVATTRPSRSATARFVGRGPSGVVVVPQADPTDA